MLTPKTDREREQARQIADDFDGQHDGRHGENRAEEMLLWAEGAVFYDAGPVVVEEDDDRAAERDRDLSCGRFECGNKADQVIKKDEDAMLPSIATYLLASWPTLSSRRSRTPTPMEFVSSASMHCCVHRAID